MHVPEQFPTLLFIEDRLINPDGQYQVWCGIRNCYRLHRRRESTYAQKPLMHLLSIDIGYNRENFAPFFQVTCSECGTIYYCFVYHRN